MFAGIIPAATRNDSCDRWYKGRDCGPRSGPENSAKAPRGISEGPVGGETRSVSALRHKKGAGFGQRFPRKLRGISIA